MIDASKKDGHRPCNDNAPLQVTPRTSSFTIYEPPNKRRTRLNMLKPIDWACIAVGAFLIFFCIRGGFELMSAAAHLFAGN